jgi:signal transduction histidine kinase
MNKFRSFNIKIALFLTGVIIAIFLLFYTQSIVKKIQNREKQIAGLYAKSLEYLANDASENVEYDFIFNEVILQIDFPVIATDKEHKTVVFMKNVEYDSTKKFSKNDTLYFLGLARDMDEINTPIKVAVQDTIILNVVHFGESSLVRALKALPYIEILIAVLFLLLGYIGFSYIKKNEQSSIWVGLSRETAHQLGTPLTSLMGWLEILKSTKPKSEELTEITKEISNDLDKLNKIAGRFSKIGSQPVLEKEDLKSLIQKVSNYFEKRIPSLKAPDGQTVKKVKIEVNSPDNLEVKVNKDLFEWVIENLMKNSLDAMDKPTGIIKFNIYENGKEITIDVSDNGKGIDMKNKKDIFRPGFSTKLRGWGLGLSLSKRIIEDYHGGKLNLIDSAAGSGATFRIKLNRE